MEGVTEEPRAFAVGDVVKLKSGGPPMTIVWLKRDNTAVCCGWFEQGEYRKNWFANECVMHKGKRK